MTRFFYVDDTGKCRIRRNGSTPEGEPWFVVEFKGHSDAQWQWHLCGTADWLAMTPQEISWANANPKR